MKTTIMATTILFSAAVAFAKTTTWRGAAGGKWSVDANWSDGRPCAGDTVVLTGDSENDIANLSLAALTLGGGRGFTTSGKALTLGGPLAITSGGVFTNALDITVDGAQTWNVGGTDATLVQTGSLSASGTLTSTGRGTLELRGENALTGGFKTSETHVHAYTDAAFSASGEGTVEIDRSSTDKYGRLSLHQVTLRNPMTVKDHDSRRHSLVSAAGTTNVLQGPVTTTSSVYPGVAINSTLVFEGGMKSQNHNLFRPCCGYNGGEAEAGTGDATSWIVIRKTPFSGFQGLGYNDRYRVRLEVAGNEFDYGGLAASTGYGGVTLDGVATTLECAVPFALDSADGDGPIRRFNWSTFDLGGCDQRVGGFVYLTATRGTIRSAKPATLYLVQKMIQCEGGKPTTIRPLFQDIEGQVSISKSGTNTTYLAGAKTATGRLEVTEGDLDLAADFSWAGTDVVVAGTNTVASMGDTVVPGNLIVRGGANLNRDSVLKIYGDGTLTIADGKSVWVRELWKADATGDPVRLYPGDYTAANCSFVKGEGRLHVRGGGLYLFLR